MSTPTINTLALLLAASLFPAHSRAQSTRADNDAISQLDTIIVTGTPQGRSHKDAPFAISVMPETLIDRSAPTSSVELLRTIPGFSAEPSGGRGGGQNIYARGLPSGGWIFVQYQEDGLSLFDEPQESFLNIDTLFQLDMMSQRVEVVRGGTSPLFATNAPGGTVNVITRRGGAEPEGALRVSAGSHAARRADGYSSGPLSQTVRYALGGYVRSDDGLREPGFTANKGGQIRGNLTFLLSERMTLDVDAKLLDENTAFYTAIPLADPTDPARTLAPWIDPLKGTLASNDLRYHTAQSFIGNQNISRNIDLADGIDTKVRQLGAKLHWDAGNGLTVDNHLRWVDAEVAYSALFSGAAPVAADVYLGRQLTRAQAGFGAGVERVGYVHSASGTVYNPFDDSGLVLEIGLWHARTRLRTLSDDLRLSKAFAESRFGQHTLTAGINAQRFHFEQSRLQSTLLTTLTHQSQRLDVLAFDTADQVLGSVTRDGFVRYANGALAGIADGTYLSPYLWDSVKFGRFGLDVGIRFTRYRASGGNYANSSRNLGDASTLADDNVLGISDTLTARSDRRNALQWTLGGEYAITPRVQAFARFTRSERLPRLQNVYLTQNLDGSSIDQAELGLRGGISHGFNFSAVLFGSRFNELSLNTSVLDMNNNVQVLALVGKTRTLGLESEFTWRPAALFSLTGSFTLQQPDIRNLSNATTNTAFPELDGNQISRIPKRIAALTPTLHLELAGKPVDVSLSAYHMGQRFVDYTNATALPSYTSYDFNLFAQVSQRLEFQLRVANLNNTIGLTEGNGRVDQLGGQGAVNAIYARPLFGRDITASLTWRW